MKLNSVLTNCLLLYALLAFIVSCQHPDKSPLPDNQPTRDDNLAMDNPSGAGASDVNDYLIDKNTYVLSYTVRRELENPGNCRLDAQYKYGW